jgi:DNA-binding transcriptional LysR family regulator
LRNGCPWRSADQVAAFDRSLSSGEHTGRAYRVLYTSANSGAVAAAVLSGLAVSVFPESGLRPGMRVLTPGEGFPELPSCRIGLMRNPHDRAKLADALAGHIISSLDNLSEAAHAAE